MICWHKQKITVKTVNRRSKKSDFSFSDGFRGSESKFVGRFPVPESFYIHRVINDITLAQNDTEFE